MSQTNDRERVRASQAGGSNWQLNLSHGEPSVANHPALAGIDPKGRPFIRVHNVSGLAAVASATADSGATWQVMTGVSVATGQTDLVDVRGCQAVRFDQIVTYRLTA